MYKNSLSLGLEIAQWQNLYRRLKALKFGPQYFLQQKERKVSSVFILI